MQSQGNSAAPNTLSSTVAINVINEIFERYKRKCNLIVHNLPEEPLDNQHIDKDTFPELCRKIFNLNINIVKVARLGQKSSTNHILYLSMM